jgi:hypothetical protein
MIVVVIMLVCVGVAVNAVAHSNMESALVMNSVPSMAIVVMITHSFVHYSKLLVNHLKKEEGEGEKVINH